MKIKKVILALAALATLGSANAVTLTLTGIANTSQGFVTAGATSNLVTGSVYFYSSTNDLTPASLAGLAASSDKAAFFASQLTGGVAIRGPVAFANGAFTSSASSELGPAGNFLYMLIVGNDGSVGAYQNIVVPALGSVLMNASNMTEDLVGTSTLQTIGGTASGYQLFAAVPEPSVALLGALGIFGLVRRRR